MNKKEKFKLVENKQGSSSKRKQIGRLTRPKTQGLDLEMWVCGFL